MNNSQKAEIKALIFDFIGVLLVKKENYKSDPVIDAIDGVIGRVTDDFDFKKRVMKKYEIDESEFNQFMEKIVNKYEAHEGIWNLIDKIKKKYKLAIINNGTVFTLPKFIKKYKIDKKFDLFVSSAIEGIRKPDKRIYLITAKRLGVKPENCLFMDDYYDNVVGAQKCGMQAIYWKNPDQAFNELLNFLNKN